MVSAIYLVLVMYSSAYKGGVAIESVQIQQSSMAQCQVNAKRFHDKNMLPNDNYGSTKAYCIVGVK